MGDWLHKVLGLIGGKPCDHSSSFIFDLFFLIIAGNKENHKISNGFEIRQDPKAGTYELAALERLEKSP